MATFNFDSIIHLLGRHPQLARDKNFNEWLENHGASLWHETHADAEGLQTVIVQSQDRRFVFGALLQIDSSRVNDGIITERVLRNAQFNLISDTSALSDVTALRLLNAEHPLDSSHVQASRPVIDFTKEPATMSWEIETYEGGQVRRFLISHPSKVEKVNKVEPKRPLIARKVEKLSALAALVDDSLEENELHHLTQYAATARSWAQGATTTADKAFRIWLNVRQKMVYDANITYIGEFTWADSLVIDQLGWRGICDEWAVVQITMLRALGIPAVMKFLIWNSNGQAVGHACLEWLDGSNWRHMDSLWNAFDNRAVYRTNGGANSLTVMDGSYPRDSRSTVPAWGIPDPTGDLKLYPYGDYIINPGYPGNARPGYSY